MAEVRINPEVLIWARNSRDIDRTEAALRLKINEDDLEAYETGQKQPNVGLLRKMATQYKVNFGSLFMPEPLLPAPTVNDFRTLEGRDPAVNWRTLVAIDTVRDSIDLLLEAVGEHPELLRSTRLSEIGLDNDPEQVAAEERLRLGISVDEQLGWRNDLEAFRHWRAAVERQQVAVFLLKFPVKDCRGFSHSEDSLCAIAISDEEFSYSAKIFTLIHEYCHLLLREFGLSDQDPRNQVERFCNQFAANMLMPRELLRAALDLPSRIETVEWGDEQIRSAARAIKVSKYAIALRLEELGYARTGFYQDRAEAWRAQDASAIKRTGGRSTWAQRNLRRVGGFVSDLTLRALDAGAISKRDANTLLGMKPTHLPDLREALEAHQTNYVAS